MVCRPESFAAFGITLSTTHKCHTSETVLLLLRPKHETCGDIVVRPSSLVLLGPREPIRDSTMGLLVLAFRRRYGPVVGCGIETKHAARVE